MKIITLLIFLLCYSFGISQISTKDSSYNCIANWTKGEEKILLIKRNKQNYNAGIKEPPFEFSYEAYVEILDVTDDNYKIKWTFHLPEAFKNATPGIAEAMPVYEGLNMIFLTDKMGAFKELINWEEVKDAYVKMMEVSLPKKMDDVAKAILEKTKAMFNSKQMVEGALIKEIQLYYAPYGAAFTLAGLSTLTSLPNPFTEEPLPAILTQKITDLSFPDYVKFSIEQKIDIVNASKLFEGILRQMNISEDSILVQAKELLANIEITDQSEFVVTSPTGWIKEMTHQRIARNSQMSNKESFIIVLKDNK